MMIMTKTKEERLRRALASSKAPAGRKDTHIQIRVSATDKNAFEDAAAREGLSLSAWLLYVARIASGVN
jgi:uncharacterized protein (DUF1778 family)